MNTTTHQTDLTSKQLTFLIDNYKKLSLEQLGIKMNKSASWIFRKLKELNLKKDTFRFTEYEIEFIKKNYPIHGAKYCSLKLNKTIKQIRCKKTKLNLNLNDGVLSNIVKTNHINNPKKYENYSVNPEKFLKIETKEVAYLLGLIWSDGYVHQKGYSNTVSVSMVEEDIEHLLSIFDTIGNWSKHHRKRKGKKPSITVSINNKPVVNFLLKHGYHSKSYNSADEILSIISYELQPYWFRGLIDGDGSIYHNDKNKCYQLSIASTYKQNWLYCENLFKKLKIRYGICRRRQKRKNKIHTGSIIRISNKKDIIKFCNYIYFDFDKTPMGLVRKYEKFIHIKNSMMTTI